MYTNRIRRATVLYCAHSDHKYEHTCCHFTERRPVAPFCEIPVIAEAEEPGAVPIASYKSDRPSNAHMLVLTLN